MNNLLNYSAFSEDGVHIIVELILFIYILSIYLTVIVVFSLGVTGLVKTSYGLYKSRYQPKTKRRHRPPRINLKLRYAWQGVHAGRWYLTDANSFRGVGLLRLGISRHLRQFQVGGVLVWGIVSCTPNTTICIFRMSRLGVRFVGDNYVTYEGTVLRRVPSYKVVGPFYNRQVELMFT